LEIALIRAIQTLGEASFDTIIDALEELKGGAGVTPTLKPAKKTPEKSDIKSARAFPATKPPESIVPVQTAIEKPESKKGSATAPEPAPEMAVEPLGNEAATDRSMESVWRLVVNAVRARRPLIVSWIETATPLSMEKGSFLIGFPLGNDLAIETLSRSNNRKFIEELLSEIQSGAWKIEFEQRETLKPAERPSASAKTVDPMEEFKKDPMIRKALEIFKAEIQTEG
jgi:hypothetical protein